MGNFQGTHLWRRTLAPQMDEDLLSPARERLRSVLLKMRERAELLAAEIARDLPEFTVHDITHLDTLWELSDLITPDDFPLSPPEAFVLGGAFLVHDLGMGLAAYPEGRKVLQLDPIWADTMAALRRADRGRPRSNMENADREREIELEATSELLRLRHARHAEQIATVSWRGPDGQLYHLIEDVELQQALGSVIGQIAHSHWWPIEEVRRRLADLPLLGAPALLSCPKEWSIDRIKLACLLRAADSAHLDARRAPGFLRALRRPAGYADLHWGFQQHIHQPTLDSERLVFTSGHEFTAEEASSWWVGYELLQACDRTLHEVDTLLQDLKHGCRFRARAVAALEEPDRLVAHIPTRNWLPVDTRVQVTDVAGLVRKLGGEQLYGENPTVPLRELLQNAADAVRARRHLEQSEATWGKVVVCLGKDSIGAWIEIEDNGVGMSIRVLTGPFLDFGKSLWTTHLGRTEFPGLLATGFSPTGKFGIGFFSAFIWGDRLRVTTRRFDEAQAATLVLEFSSGLLVRPILRAASFNERRADGGTTIRVWLTPRMEQELPRTEEELAKLCRQLCPGLDVTLYVDSEDGAMIGVRANDWLEIPAQKLLERVIGEYEPLTRENIQRDALEFAANIRPLLSSSGDVIGRGWIAPLRHSQSPFVVPTCLLTVGGFATPGYLPFCGMLAAETSDPIRKIATPIASADELSAWATNQAELLSQISENRAMLAICAVYVNALGGETRKLPVVLGSQGWLSASDFARACIHYEEVFLLLTYQDVTRKRISRDDVFIIRPSARFRYLETGLTLLEVLLEELASAWECSAHELIVKDETRTSVAKRIRLLIGVRTGDVLRLHR